MITLARAETGECGRAGGGVGWGGGLDSAHWRWEAVFLKKIVVLWGLL